MATGKAYGFFQCNASKEAIATALPTLRRMTQVPDSLETLLHTDLLALHGDDRFRSLAQEAHAAGNNYVLEGRLPGTNRQAADDIAALLNQAYQSPLYQKDEPFSVLLSMKKTATISLEISFFSLFTF